MRLYVEEIRAVPLVQEFTRTDAAIVTFFRLHLYKHLSPAGTFVVSLTDMDDNILATCSQSLAQMQTLGNAQLQANYFHGQVTFQLDKAVVLKPGTYKLQLSATGYTYVDTAFIGWVKADTDPSVPVEGSPLPVDSAYDFEMYVLERVR